PGTATGKRPRRCGASPPAGRPWPRRPRRPRSPAPGAQSPTRRGGPAAPPPGESASSPGLPPAPRPTSGPSFPVARHGAAPRPRPCRLQPQTWYCRQPLPIPAADLLFLADQLIDPLQRRQAEGRLEVGHLVLVADRADQERDVRMPAVVAQVPHALEKSLVVG